MANCTKILPLFQKLLYQKRNQGKSFKEIVIAVAGKLLRESSMLCLVKIELLNNLLICL